MIKYDTLINRAQQEISQAMEKMPPGLESRIIGRVRQFYGGIAQTEKLPGLGYGELVSIGNGIPAMAMDVTEKEASLVLLQKGIVDSGALVRPLGRMVKIPVGEGLLGRVLSPIGEPQDNSSKPKSERFYPIEREAPSILDRVAVEKPVQTGIKVIDSLIPIGHGQRELILGDRRTGKSAIAIDTILNQKGKNVICIYCSIGQRLSSTAKVIARLKEEGAMEYSCVIIAKGDDPPGARFISPYAAMSIAEYFAEKGKEVIIVFDDLTKHARAYREITLLLKRPPGREAYPGDIFYIHARLLERSANLQNKGSITALPIVETEEQNISAYIPTNLISITDGQIFTSPKLFEKGVLPAVDIGKSVSRVGGKAQLPSIRKIAGDLKLQYAQFEELETFSKYGSQVEENVRKTLERGKRIRALFKQFEGTHAPIPSLLIILLALQHGLFDEIEIEKMEAAEKKLRENISIPDQIEKRILEGKKLSEEEQADLVEQAEKILEENS